LVGGAKDVTALRANILSAVAAIHAYTSEVRSSATAAQSNSTQTMTVALQQASAASRTTTAGFMHDYYDRRIFDPYLYFASANDEEEYRRREDERRRAIEKAEAEHTPEGDLHANQLAIEQLKDAGAHGADRSPEYQKRLDALNKSNDDLKAAQTAARAKGNETPTADPLDAAKPAANVSPDLIASLRASGVHVPDQDGGGHGVTARPSQTALGRG
jgi:hypothetical protein